MYMHTNPNPRNHEIDDCVIRAIAIATGHSWDYVQLSLFIYSFDLKGMSSTNFVWDSYLRDIGYKRYNPPDVPHRFTVKDFCNMCRAAIEEKEKSDGIGGNIQNKPKE